MIISRTPFRISFFGGGTDYPNWYNEHGGAVLATTINKYCYISCRYLPPFFEHKFRIVWSKMEHVGDISEIQHAAVRACLEFMKVDKGVEIHHNADLPARTGIGSSSTFTVGLLHALYALKGVMPTKRQLALGAIHLEQEIMKESVGSQDQALAAFGGFNLIKFGGRDHLQVMPATISHERVGLLQDHMMLLFTGFSRTASKIAKEQIRKTHKNRKELKMMYEMVVRSIEILNGSGNLEDFGKLLHDNWQLKRGLSDKITNYEIDQIYSTARRAGALGGKLLGAGGGGFILLFARPQLQPKIREKLKKLLYVPFRFENLGSQIIFYSPGDSLVYD